MRDIEYDRFNDPVQPTRKAQNTTSADALVELHCEQLARADLVLVFHPTWPQ
jgi:NAD(P)H dehydrogenase (quinone)